MIVIGIDVGGTSIKGGAIRDTGEVLDTFSIRTDKNLSPEDMFGLLCEEINKFISTHKYDEKISGVGLGIPGLLDKKKGIIFSSPNMPTWLDFEVTEYISSRVHLPVKIVNDASAAALGEARYGSGKDYENLIMITLGTGVGGGIVLNKKLYDGLGGTGAQLGHSLIELNGRQCNCGRKGCLEAYASATALIKDTEKAVKDNPNSVLTKIAKEEGKVSGRTAFKAESLNCPVGHKVVEDYIMYLSEGLLDYCNIFRPDIFVLSGGIANEGENLINRIRAYLKERNYGFLGSPEVLVKQANLGYDSGKIGAASLFFYND